MCEGSRLSRVCTSHEVSLIGMGKQEVTYAENGLRLLGGELLEYTLYGFRR